MARATTTEPSRVYVGMLLLTALCMLAGIIAMALEATEYDWTQKPPTTPALTLPGPPTPRPAPGGSAMVPVPTTDAVVEAPKPVVAPITAAPVVVAETPKPIFTDTMPPPAGVVAPSATPVVPSGPIPSPFELPKR